MRVLTLNPGSATLKAALIEDGQLVAAQTLTGVELHSEASVRQLLTAWLPYDAVAIRFVHGGSRPDPQLLDEVALIHLERLASLAPLHQHRAVELARQVRGVVPEVAVVACFDTTFHRRLPAAAAQYPLPRPWTQQNRLRRYGFHGLSCQYAVRRSAKLLDMQQTDLQLLVCHVGSGVSVTAVRNGYSVDTSMGFTPLEGAMMCTRSGSVDPGLLLHILGTGEVTVEELTSVLYHESGLAGMTGTSGDIREVLGARAAGDHDATVALQVYLHRLRREIGSAAMSHTRLDAIAFTGGVVEHQQGLLAELCSGLALLGVSVDPDLLAGSGDRRFDSGSGPALLVVHAREDLELARQAEAVLTGQAAADSLV